MKIKIYFLEIKNRLILLLFVLLTGILVCYFFKEVLLFTVLKQSICLNKPFYFIFTDVSEIFYVYIMLIFFVSNQIVFLCFFYHVFMFLSTGLFYSEYKYLTFIFKISFVCFLFSIFVYSKVLFPVGWDFFLSFQNSDVIKLTTFYFESKISEFLVFYISFYYVSIFQFQVLVLLFVIFDCSQSKTELARKFRKIFYYFFVILSTLVTPPDVFNQLFLSLFLFISYEILVFYFIYKKF